MCITVIVIPTIKLTTWLGGGQRHTKRFPTMPVQLEGKAINKSQGVSRRMGRCKNIAISQTKVSFSQAATSKLILMTMIGTLISIAPVRCFLSPYFNISPFPGFWCLTERKDKTIFLLKGHTARVNPGCAHVTVNVPPPLKYMIRPPFPLLYTDGIIWKKQKGN